MSKPCPHCGKNMDRQSKMCRSCYGKQKARPENYIARICPTCGESFTVHKCHIERGQGVYCSRSCARSGSPTHPKTRQQVVCNTCGESFEKHLAEITKNVGDLHFCSPRCWYEHNQGDNHYGWEGGQHQRLNAESSAWRKAVLDRDAGFCRLCHSQERLEVHHIHRFATHPDLRWEVDNGLTLCHDCHVKFRNQEEQYADILGFIASVRVEVWNV